MQTNKKFKPFTFLAVFVLSNIFSFAQDNITVNISASACNSYNWNGINYTESGVYAQIFTDQYGRDSTVFLYLTVKHLYLAIVSSGLDFCEQSQNVLTAITNSSEVLWNTGATTPSIAIDKPGLYTVTAVDEPCRKTDSLRVYECNVGIQENVLSGVRVYPNPTTGQLRVECRDVAQRLYGDYHIYTLTSQMIMRGQLQGETTIINMESLPTGMYYLRIGSETVKVVKE